MKLYMKVTNDKYELPLAVGNSFAEIARMQGMAVSSVYTAIWYARKYPKNKHKAKYITVEVEDD